MTDIGRFATRPGATGIDRLGQPQVARTGIQPPTVADILGGQQGGNRPSFDPRPTASASPETANRADDTVRQIRVDQSGATARPFVEPNVAPIDEISPAEAGLPRPQISLLSLDTLTSLQALTQPTATDSPQIRLPEGFDPTRPFRAADQLDQAGAFRPARLGSVPSAESVLSLFPAPGDALDGEDFADSLPDVPPPALSAVSGGLGTRPGSILNLLT